MSWRDELSLVLSREGTAPPSLFFRQADAMRLEGCLTLLLREGQSLALSSHSEAALDHYAELLVHRLRRSAGCPVDIYFPASTAALVTRFEERVASLTLKQAMATPADPQPERIWLVHEAGALAPGELQLLTRLVGNFPGAGVRVVLLFGASHPARQGFEGLGRRFARWDIVAPTADEAAAMREQARQDGTQGVMSLVLDRLMPAPVMMTAAEVLQARAQPVSPVDVSDSPPPPELRSAWRRWLSAWGSRVRRSSASAQAARSAPAVTDVQAKAPTDAGLGRFWRVLPSLLQRLRHAGGKRSSGRKRPSSSTGPRP